MNMEVLKEAKEIEFEINLAEKIINFCEDKDKDNESDLVIAFEDCVLTTELNNYLIHSIKNYIEEKYQRLAIL
jgi:hypothetical protein